MIVRISTEGQYEVPAEDVEALNELDDKIVMACDTGDEEKFHASYEQLLEFVRSKGQPVDEDHLGGSDVIFPPPDVSLEEARSEFTGEGLIPN